MASNNNPLHNCVCKTFNDELKKNINAMEIYLQMEMEHKPKLVRRIQEIISDALHTEVFKAIQVLNKYCDEIGYDNIEPSLEIGCTANNHHCLCNNSSH